MIMYLVVSSVPAILLLCIVLSVALGTHVERNDKVLIMRLFGCFPPHEALTNELNKKIANFAVPELNSFSTFPNSQHLEESAFKGSTSVSRIEASFDLPIWCLGSEDYNKYPKCRDTFHNSSVLDENLFLLRASGWTNISVNFTRTPLVQAYPKTTLPAFRLALNAHIEIVFALEFKMAQCTATPINASVEINPDHVAIFDKDTFPDTVQISTQLDSLMINVLPLCPSFSRYKTLIDRILVTVGTNVSSLLPGAFADEDVSRFICSSI